MLRSFCLLPLQLPPSPQLGNHSWLQLFSVRYGRCACYQPCLLSSCLSVFSYEEVSAKGQKVNGKSFFPLLVPSSMKSSFPSLDTQNGYMQFLVCLFPEILFPVVCVLPCAVFLLPSCSGAGGDRRGREWPPSGAVCWVSTEVLALGCGVYFRGGSSGRAPGIA